MDQSLYARMGGRERISIIASDIVDLHLANPLVNPRFRHVDCAALKRHA